MVYHSFTFAIPVSILHSLFLVSGFDNQMTPGSDSDRQAPFGIGKVRLRSPRPPTLHQFLQHHSIEKLPCWRWRTIQFHPKNSNKSRVFEYNLSFSKDDFLQTPKECQSGCKATLSNEFWSERRWSILANKTKHQGFASVLELWHGVSVDHVQQRRQWAQVNDYRQYG